MVTQSYSTCWEICTQYRQQVVKQQPSRKVLRLTRTRDTALMGKRFCLLPTAAALKMYGTSIRKSRIRCRSPKTVIRIFLTPPGHLTGITSSPQEEDWM